MTEPTLEERVLRLETLMKERDRAHDLSLRLDQELSEAIAEFSKQNNINSVTDLLKGIIGETKNG